MQRSEHIQIVLQYDQPNLGFPGSSGGKESAFNAVDLGWEDPLEEGMATHSSILAWRIPKDRGAWQATVHGVTKSWTRETKHRTEQQPNLWID